jgi:predicted RNase H-like nuclease (RuvC/YqgF family)
VHTAEEQRAARKEMARLERQVERIERQVAQLHAEMAEKATDHLAIGELDERLRGLLAEREEIEGRWLTAAEIAG